MVETITTGSVTFGKRSTGSLFRQSQPSTSIAITVHEMKMGRRMERSARFILGFPGEGFHLGRRAQQVELVADLDELRARVLLLEEQHLERDRSPAAVAVLLVSQLLALRALDGGGEL